MSKEGSNRGNKQEDVGFFGRRESFDDDDNFGFGQGKANSNVNYFSQNNFESSPM